MKINNAIEKDYKEKLAIKEQIEQKLIAKVDGNSLKDFAQIRKYMKGMSPFIDRGIIAAHLDFEPITTFIANKQPFTVVSGKNPSEPLHLGHLAVFRLLLDLQKLGADVFIPLTNDESYVDGKVDNLGEGKRIAYTTIIPDIIALGFDSKKTKIFVHTDYMDLYKLAMHYGAFVNQTQLASVFGKSSIDTVSKVFYRGALQLASILLPQSKKFGGAKHILVPVATDQHPYILISRDVAKANKLIPPSEITISFLLGLKHPLEKMSGSKPDSCIYLTDNAETVTRKIRRAYTGSLASLEGHRKYGAIPEICPVFQILRYHHPDNEFVDDIYSKYKGGELLASELKTIVTDFIIDLLSKQRARREALTQEEIERFILQS